MSGILWIVLGLAIGLLTPLLVMRWRRSSTAGAKSLPAAPGRPQYRTPLPNRPQNPTQARPSVGIKRKLALKFHGVSMKPGLEACPAVQQLAGQRFLPEEAPAMPLPACNQKKCHCAYSHHSDRREQGERRSGWGTFGGFTAPAVPGGDRRRGMEPDRRSRPDSQG